MSQAAPQPAVAQPAPAFSSWASDLLRTIAGVETIFSPVPILSIRQTRKSAQSSQSDSPWPVRSFLLNPILHISFVTRAPDRRETLHDQRPPPGHHYTW